MTDHIDSAYTLASEISSITHSRKSHQKLDKSKKSESKHISKTFNETLSEARTELETTQSAESMDNDALLVQLQDAVFSAGDTLKRKTTLETIQEYKNSVAALLKYVVSHTYDFKKTPDSRYTMYSRKPKSIKSSTIRIIDERLEKFTKDLISNQLSQLDILKRIDEIKGLIIDMLR